MNPRKSGYPRLLACAAVVLGPAAQLAHAETPLSLVVSENLTHDSNILRDNSNKYSDTLSSTGIQAGFNKQYGRQTYKASATVQANRYKTSKAYDNDGYNMALGFATEIASNWRVSLDHTRTSQIQGFQDQGLRRFKEPIKSQSTDAFIQYGLHGRWSLNANLTNDKVDYEVQNQSDKDAAGGKLGLRYSPTDLLYFDVGYRRTNSDMPKYEAVRYEQGVSFGTKVGEEIKRNDLEFSTQWIVTGYSSLNGRLAWTQERFKEDQRRDFNGLTGRLGWDYTPSGKISYSIFLDRDTNNAGGSTRQSASMFWAEYNNQKRVSTGLQAKVGYSVTSKISLNASALYRRIQEERNYVLENVLPGGGSQTNNDKSTGSYRSLSLGANYAFNRNWRLGCTLERYERSSLLFSRDFSGDSVNCAAIFEID